MDVNDWFRESTVVSSQRLQRIQSKFVSTFQCTPQFLVRAPGRVNLIGEHVDYSGFDVLPMAIGVSATILPSLILKKTTWSLPFPLGPMAMCLRL